MRKLLFTTILSIVILFSFSQQSENIFSITIANGAPSGYLVPVGADITLVDIHGTATLSDNWNIQAASAPLFSQSIWLLYRGTVTRGAFHITVFGVKLPSHMYTDTVMFKSTYTGGSWKTVLVPNFGNVGMVGQTDIGSDAYDGTTITVNASDELEVKDEGITLAKMVDLVDTKVLIGDGSDRPVAYALSGDISMSNVGVTDIQTDAIITGNITDEAITKEKIEDITRGSILIGGASDRPVELAAKTSGKMLIGDGTDLVSVAMSGDIGLAANGTTTIQTDAITTTHITDENVTLAKIEDLTSGYVIVGNGSNRPIAVVLSGDVKISSTGVTTIQSSAIDNAMLASDIQPTKTIFDITTSTGFYNGFCAVKTIGSTQLKSLLDGSENQLFSLKDGEIVLYIVLAVQTASGGAATVTIGPDATVRSAGKDINGIALGIDINVAAIYSSLDNTYAGAQQDFGFFEADGSGNGYILIESSANQSASAFVGSAIMYYMPNN